MFSQIHAIRICFGGISIIFQLSSRLTVLGDWNEILSSDEAFPALTVNQARCARFSDSLDFCNLQTIEPLGCRYSWVQLHEGRVTLRERLDRAVANLEFHTLFPTFKAINLTRISSDHHPVMLDTCDLYTSPLGERPKRFLPAWLERDDFCPTFQAY